MPVIPMSRQPITNYLDYSEFTEFIASTTSIIQIADSRSSLSTVCLLTVKKVLKKYGI